MLILNHQACFVPHNQFPPHDHLASNQSWSGFSKILIVTISWYWEYITVSMHIDQLCWKKYLGIKRTTKISETELKIEEYIAVKNIKQDQMMNHKGSFLLLGQLYKKLFNTKHTLISWKATLLMSHEANNIYTALQVIITSVYSMSMEKYCSNSLSMVGFPVVACSSASKYHTQRM